MTSTRKFFFWRTYFEDEHESEDVDEAEWDQAKALVQSRGEHVEDPDVPHRALCPECGSPLRRIAKLPKWKTCLMCMRTADCERCEEEILPGELHFGCNDCEICVCNACGPGVYIERVMDFKNSITGEARIEDLPSTVLHKRKKYGKRGVLSAPSPGIGLALEVVARVPVMADQVANSEEEVLDREWDAEDTLSTLLGTQAKDCRAMAEGLLILAAEVKSVLAREGTLTEMDLPCKVFGDIHGQFRDLLLLLHSFGMPSGNSAGPSFVFNGDFVDRGRHQLEVIAALFSYKIANPRRVNLNRGNHEDMHMNSKYGFEKHCIERLGEDYGRQVYLAVNDAFDYLPLGCLIGGRVLALHGGIGQGNWSLQRLREVPRPLSHGALADPANQWLWNILWSDPIEDDQRRQSFGVHQSPRSKTAFRFGWNVTSAFCAKNGLDLIIRSHQCKKAGFGFDVMHGDSLVRVFSARDYEGNGNDGAVLHLALQDASEGRHGLITVRPQVLHSLTKADAAANK